MVQQQRMQIRIILRGSLYGILWILISLYVAIPLARPYSLLPYNSFPVFGVLIFTLFIRHAVLHYDFLSSAGKRYELLFSLSRNGFALVDQSGRIVDANEAFRKMLGPLPSNWKGMQVHQLVVFEDKKQF
jgi:PAS domain-containing protein